MIATRRSGATILYILVLILSLTSLLLLLQTVKVATAGYDLQQLQQVREEWKQRNHQLLAEISSLQSLTWVEKEAKARLNMVPATQHLYVTVALAPETGTSALEPYSYFSDKEEAEASNLMERWQQRIQSWKTALGLSP